MKTACIIIAGGKSERMGRDKKFLKIRGKYFIEHVLDAAKKISGEVIVVLGNEEQKKEMDKKIKTNAKIVIDEIKGAGPLNALLAGLKNCGSEYAVVLPCDSPLIEPQIFLYLLERCRGFDAAVPKDKYAEPMHAAYRVAAMRRACEESFAEDENSLNSALKRLHKVNYVPLGTLRQFDEKLLSFRNINTREDFERLVKEFEACHGRKN